MPSFVLVHGAAHGAWCWERVVPHLEASPRVEAVVAVDLTGHGARLDAKPQAAITRADYVADVVREVELRDLRDVVLVGHSLAGISVPEAAARLAPRMRRLILLSTAHPEPGRSVEQLMAHPLSPLSRGVDFERMFCNDLDADATAWLLGHLGPEPAGPMREAVPAVSLPQGLPSSYVLLERDEALPPALQRELARTAGAGEVLPFDAGHSAFASRPRELAELLLRWV
jgi:pimeloyl-ACP methyl ester carboxylesterase